MQRNILLVEDEEQLARFVELELKHEGYEVMKSGNGREALEIAEKGGFDLILLDIMLPGLNGLEVLRRVRATSDVPVILLTARDAVMDKVAGLDAGASDYITKPFAIEELLARIRVVLRNADKESSAGPASAEGGEVKNGRQADGSYRWEQLTLDMPKREVRYDGALIEMTNREFLMLETLLSNMDIVLPRDTLLERVCGYDYLGETNIVDVYVRHIRAKIDEVYGVKMIQTIRGVGYVIKSEN